MVISCFKLASCDSILSSINLQNLAIYPSSYLTSITCSSSITLDSSCVLLWANVDFQIIGQSGKRVWQFQGSGYCSSKSMTIKYTTTTPYDIGFEGALSGTVSTSSYPNPLNINPLVTIKSITGKQNTIVEIHFEAPFDSWKSFYYNFFILDNRSNNPYSSFIQWDPINLNFTNMGIPWFPIGPNVKWLGLLVVSADQQNCYVPPTKSQVDEVIQAAVDMKATCIRSHTIGNSSFSTHSLLPKQAEKGSTSVPINEAAWDIIDYTVYQCKQKGIKIFGPWTDQYCYYNGNYNVFVTDPNEDFFTSDAAKTRFKNYIQSYLEHVNKYTNIANKNEPTFFCWELGNELGDHCGESSGGTCFQNCDYNKSDNFNFPATLYKIPPKEWLEEISAYIKSQDPNHLVMSPTDFCQNGESGDCNACDYVYDISNIDIISVHCYISGCPSQSKLDELYIPIANKAHMANKALIMGEYESYYPGYANNATVEVPPAKFTYTCPFLSSIEDLEKKKQLNGDFFWDLIINPYTQSDPYSFYYTTNPSTSPIFNYNLSNIYKNHIQIILENVNKD